MSACEGEKQKVFNSKLQVYWKTNDFVFVFKRLKRNHFISIHDAISKIADIRILWLRSLLFAVSRLPVPAMHDLKPGRAGPGCRSYSKYMHCRKIYALPYPKYMQSCTFYSFIVYGIRALVPVLKLMANASEERSTTFS